VTIPSAIMARAADPDQCKTAANECLRLAQRTGNPSVRNSLLAMAQRWMEFAGEDLGTMRFQTMVDQFNDQQMSGMDAIYQPHKKQPQNSEVPVSLSHARER
jgi:hypothetical protein